MSAVDMSANSQQATQVSAVDTTHLWQAKQVSGGYDCKLPAGNTGVCSGYDCTIVAGEMGHCGGYDCTLVAGKTGSCGGYDWTLVAGETGVCGGAVVVVVGV